MDCRELETSALWWNGSKWLTSFKGLENREEIEEGPVPKAFLVENEGKGSKDSNDCSCSER